MKTRLRTDIACGLVLVAGIVTNLGCAPAGGQGSKPANNPYSAAIEDSEDKAERPYIEASEPILEAIAKRDYETLYGFVSSHALAKVDPEQFGPTDESVGKGKKSEPIVNMTKEQFLDMMKEMEKRLAVPKAVDHLYVQTIDPKELAGKGDPLDNMFNIGAMSPDIPFEIRKASIRAQITCELPDEAVKQIAQDLKISEEQVRSGKWPENDEYDEEMWPYINLKFVLVEDGGKLKIGYFEFMPPSMLD